MYTTMKYDAVVIGGGPAGMMTAGKCAEQGARVILLEKNKQLGIKLLMTGNGRCNLTNKTEDIKQLTEKFGKNGKFLFSVFHQFGVIETIRFFEKRGIQTKTEENNKVFPASDRASDILKALISFLEEFHVKIRVDAQVKNIIQKEKRIEKIILANNEEIVATNYIICTGGKSYPDTGSTGDGYTWAKQLGHTIIEPRPALTSLILKDSFIPELQGLSLKNIGISLYKSSKKMASQCGEVIFTSYGISGPAILNMSESIGKYLPEKTEIQIDVVPDLDFVQLDQKIQHLFQEGNHKMLKNCLDQFLPPKLIVVVVALSGISMEKKAHLITREERKKLVHLVKDFRLEVKGLKGFDQAFITSGGIKLDEVYPKTMRSKLIENLYFAGEILDVNGPTGGYNLQVCWSTGYVAGMNSALLI